MLEGGPPTLDLVVLPGNYAVARLEPSASVPDWASHGLISSITRTPDELSIVCADEAVPVGVRAERGWRALRVAGTIDFALTGILASILSPLGAAKVSIFAVSTYDTDCVLVHAYALAPAIGALRAAGHRVREA
jgi:hypothetical protein